MKVEVAVLGSPSLTVRTLSAMDSACPRRTVLVTQGCVAVRLGRFGLAVRR